MIQFLLLISRHGKTRLNKYYRHYTQKERTAIQKEVSWDLQRTYFPVNAKIWIKRDDFLVYFSIENCHRNGSIDSLWHSPSQRVRGQFFTFHPTVLKTHIKSPSILSVWSRGKKRVQISELLNLFETKFMEPQFSIKLCDERLSGEGEEMREKLLKATANRWMN